MQVLALGWKFSREYGYKPVNTVNMYKGLIVSNMFYTHIILFNLHNHSVIFNSML